MNAYVETLLNSWDLKSCSVPSWSFSMKLFLELLNEYPLGLSPAILYSELECAWNKHVSTRSTLYVTLHSVLSPFHIDQVKWINADICSLQCSLENIKYELYLPKSLHSSIISCAPLIKEVSWTCSTCIHGKTWMPTYYMIFYSDLSRFSNSLSVDLSDKEFKFKATIIECDVENTSIILETENGELLYWDLGKVHLGFLDLIQKNDCIGFTNPILIRISESKYELEIDPSSSILFKSKQEKKDSRMENQETNKRVLIYDISGTKQDIHIYASVVAVIPNQPLCISGKQIDRFGLQLIDESNKPMDVTLWDDLGREASALQQGQVIFISNLSSLFQDGILYFNGSRDQGTRIHVLSSSKGILSSPFLFHNTYLKEAYTLRPPHFYSKCIITSCHKNNQDSFTQKIHIQCKKSMIEHGKCMICHSYLSEKDSRNDYLFYINVDDGSMSLMVCVETEIGFKLMGMNAESFLLNSSSQKKTLMERMIGLEFQASFIWNGSEYQIDCIV